MVGIRETAITIAITAPTIFPVQSPSNTITSLRA
jgi:hypothetical protein